MYLYSSYIIAENKMSDKNIIIEVNGMLKLEYNKKPNKIL